MPPKVDKEAVRKALKLRRRGMKQREIAEFMAVEFMAVYLRTVQNYLSPSWLAKKGLGDLRLEGVMTRERIDVTTVTVGPIPDKPAWYDYP